MVHRKQRRTGRGPGVRDRQLNIDWSDYERVLGEFLRTYAEGEHLKLMDKLASLKGGATNLAKRRRKWHKFIRDCISHWHHIHYGKTRTGMTPHMVTTSWAAQAFLGIGGSPTLPLTLATKGRDLGGNLLSTEAVKKAIGEMRVALVAAVHMTKMNRLGQRHVVADGRQLKTMRFAFRPDSTINTTHIKRTYDAKRKVTYWTDQYDDAAAGLEDWRELDRAVGGFLRAWSDILVSLRQLEIIARNPGGPSKGLDIETVGTDGKRMEAVLGVDHPVTRRLKGWAKEKAVLLRGRRYREGILDETADAPPGLFAVMSASSITNAVNDAIRPMGRMLHDLVNEHQSEWVVRSGTS